ncbi:MAG: hypothetical protein QGF90_09950, partial [Gammaproteobacteria bacterium]|nr:hypothetical protein [Gammaproteobacteria bacterium]
MERDCQTILVLGLLLTLLLAPPESTVVYLFGVPIAVITVTEILLASLVLIADRCAGVLLPRLMLLLPLFLVVPLVVVLLGLGQGPVISAIANLFSASSNYTPTGFSPYQQLRASVYLRPSTRAVMRIESEEQPDQYLAGNRLSILDEEMVWLPSVQPLRSYSGFEALSLSTGEFRYEIDNHHINQATTPPRSLTVHSLTNDNYLFVNPGTSHVTGRFAAISRNAADVLTPAY